MNTQNQLGQTQNSLRATMEQQRYTAEQMRVLQGSNHLAKLDASQHAQPMTPPHGVCHSLHCLSEALTGLEKSFADLAQRLDPIRRQEPVKVDSEKIGHSSGVPLVDEIDQLASRITSLDVRLEQLIGSIDL